MLVSFFRFSDDVANQTLVIRVPMEALWDHPVPWRVAFLEMDSTLLVRLPFPVCACL